MVPIFIFVTLLQPGILFVSLAEFRIQLVTGLLTLSFELVRGKIRFSWSRIHTCMVLFIIAQIISVHDSGLQQMLNELVEWIPMVGIYFMIAFWINGDENKIKQCLLGFMFGSIVVIAYGLSRFMWDPLVQERWIVGGYGMYENQNDYSYIIILSFPFWVWNLLHAKSFLIKLFCFIAIMLSVAGIVLSLSRAGILTFLFENILFGCFYVARRGIKYLLIPIMVAISIMVLFFVWEKREVAQKGSYSYEDSKDSRSDLWVTGKNMFVEHPILGIGSRRFNEYIKYYMPSWADYNMIKGKNAHNTYIEVLSTSGLFGFAPFIYAIYLSIRIVYCKFKLFLGNVKNNIAMPIMVACISYFFRSIFNSKVYTAELFMIFGICASMSMLKSKNFVEPISNSCKTSHSNIENT